MRLLPVVAASMLVGAALAQEKSEAHDENAWLRAQELSAGDEGDETTSGSRLEVAARRYEHPERDVAVTLVGVVHIGDQSYYEELQAFLDDFDLVLFESVAPIGAKPLEVGTDEERAQHTREVLKLLGGAVRTHRFRNSGELPVDLEELASASQARDSRMPRWLRSARRDGWGREIVFEVFPAAADDPDARDGWRLRSLGADGIDGSDDITHANTDQDPRSRSGPGLQAELASALGLAFQLEALDYGNDRFILADMTVRELSDAARVRDAEMSPLLDSLSGSSIPARMVKVALLALRLADLISGNQARDIIKLVLVETLSDPEILEQAQKGGRGMEGLQEIMEVILLERNEVALNALDRTLEGGAAGELALLYGAAHNPGLANGLEERGFSEVGEPLWFGAIEIDLSGSNVDPRTIEQVRRTMRSSLGASQRSRELLAPPS